MKRLVKPSWNRFLLWATNRHEPSYVDWYLRCRPRLEKFRNIHAGEDCFIIGNGPSLNRMDLSLLEGKHAFGMNKIFLMFDRCPLDLSYHVAVNPLVIEQSFEEFQNLKCPSFLSFRGTPDTRLGGERLHYLYSPKPPVSFSTSILERICEGWTVTFVALQLAYFMGFNRVFLIGVDHSFQVKGKPNEKQVLEGNDPNHFAANYFGGKEWHLPDLEGSEIAYRLAKFHFERDGREILDATVGGKLDIFPKIDYEHSIKQCAPKRSS